MVCQCTLNTLAYLALSYIGYRIVWALYTIVYPYLIASPPDLHKLAGGKWAVVTGSTDGIGKAYAFELAKKGFNLLLISRTQSKLDATKDEIKKEYKNVEVETISYDFSNANLNDYKKEVLPAIEKKDVGILVNNVGLSYDYPEILHKVDGGLQHLANVGIVNIVPTSVLTAAVLPQMVQRNNGVIVNISSSAAYAKMSLWAIYSASKAYVNHFTNILRNEYAHTGITIQTICPMMVSTKMSKARVSFFAPNTTNYVRSAIRTIGVIPETTGCIQHQIQSMVFALPEFVLDLVITKNSQAVRAAALRKREKAAKAQ
uniref:Very-long-chain 3-oxoacyl-CoA reductase n=1 Tax=Panagrolaimus sp. ES5 TaxID=591445 RepID=A0AC34F522_9BILA